MEQTELESWTYVDDVAPVLRRISGASFGSLQLLLENLQKRGKAGNGMERCDDIGSGLPLALHMKRPAVEYCDHSRAWSSPSSTDTDSISSLSDDTDRFTSFCLIVLVEEGIACDCCIMSFIVVIKMNTWCVLERALFLTMTKGTNHLCSNT
jgi:hypothetical protein